MATSSTNLKLCPRLRDVAALAQVSKSTCSAVLSERSDCYASQATRQRVLSAAEKLGYRPNRFASSLRSKRTRQVGMIVPCIFGGDPVSDEKFAPIENRARGLGYRVLFNSHWYDPANELEHIQSMLADQVDGLLLYCDSTQNSEIVKAMLEDRIPLVTIESPFAFATPNLCVLREEGAYQQVMHMWNDAGRRRLAFLVGATSGFAGRSKIDGYRRALEDLGSCLEEHVLLDATQAETTPHSAIQDGMNLSRRLLATRRTFDGLVLSSDSYGLGAMTVLQKAGLQVPRDVAVIGFDDQDIATALPVPLSTIRQPRDLGIRAFDLLMKLINEGMPKDVEEYEQIEYHTELIARESTVGQVSQ